MDAVEQFASSKGFPVPKNFFVGGASKVSQTFGHLFVFSNFFNCSVDGQVSVFKCMQWWLNEQTILAWTTAAVDNKRVVAAMPIVMDILNLHEVNPIHWSFQLKKISQIDSRIFIIITK